MGFAQYAGRAAKHAPVLPLSGLAQYAAFARKHALRVAYMALAQNGGFDAKQAAVCELISSPHTVADDCALRLVAQPSNATTDTQNHLNLIVSPVSTFDAVLGRANTYDVSEGGVDQYYRLRRSCERSPRALR